jgi:hypothetical protein
VGLVGLGRRSPLRLALCLRANSQPKSAAAVLFPLEVPLRLPPAEVPLEVLKLFRLRSLPLSRIIVLPVRPSRPGRRGEALEAPRFAKRSGRS